MQDMCQESLSNCSPSERQYYRENVLVTDDQARNIFIDTRGQNNEIWDGVRYGRLTGSISYECYTYYSNKKPDWEKKNWKRFWALFF